LAIAEANARQHGVAERMRFLRSDLFTAVSGQSFDVIVSNPPYLTADDLAALQPEVGFEPRAALAGGADGLAVIRRLLAAAPDHLAAGGWLLMEIGAAQTAAVDNAARAAGFNAVTIRPDHAGLPRVLMARR
jgi:release factor glutamine methyltransferase